MSNITIFTGSPSGDIIEKTISKPELVEDQLIIRITASGLCGTDVHARNGSNCLGHEGCGIVESVGPTASAFKVGDRVGFGYLRNSCGFCKQCLSGNETFCKQRDTYLESAESTKNSGSMASHTVWREAFAFAIPETISDEDAAPLMCGGATVFNALSKYSVGPTESVGIVGVGGLGHLAIQFAAKMGCEVTVFSGTDSKKDEALKLGATHFVATKGVENLDLQGRQLDRLLITTSSMPGKGPSCQHKVSRGLFILLRLGSLFACHGTRGNYLSNGGIQRRLGDAFYAAHSKRHSYTRFASCRTTIPQTNDRIRRSTRY
jgi:D-arabinose 1-dehydrogenase-like Zn-dependent alcohol dehydrogenase